MPARNRHNPTKTFQITPELLELVKSWAEHSGKSDSEVIRVALIEGFKVIATTPSILPRAIDPQDLTPPPPKKKRPRK